MNNKEALLQRASSLLAHSVELGNHADSLEFGFFLSKLVTLANDGRGLLSAIDVPVQKVASAVDDIKGEHVYKFLCEITGDPVKAQAIMAASAEDGVNAELSGELDDLDDDNAPDDILAMSLDRLRSEAERRDYLQLDGGFEPYVTIKDINQPAVT